MKLRPPKLAGFTLIEVLVAISIVSVLSSVVLSSVSTARQKSLDARTLEHKHQVQIAMVMYYGQYGGYPYTGVTGDPSCIGGNTCYQNGVLIGTNPSVVRREDLKFFKLANLLFNVRVAEAWPGPPPASTTPPGSSGLFPKIVPDNTQNSGILYQCNANFVLVNGFNVCPKGSAWISYYLHSTNSWVVEAAGESY